VQVARKLSTGKKSGKRATLIILVVSQDRSRSGIYDKVRHSALERGVRPKRLFRRRTFSAAECDVGEKYRRPCITRYFSALFLFVPLHSITFRCNGQGLISECARSISTIRAIKRRSTRSLRSFDFPQVGVILLSVNRYTNFTIVASALA